jgi:FMN phosphatase YigB (HAD superfamily)
VIDWQGIETVLLDMDGTLLDLHFDNYFWQEYLPLRYAEIKGMEAQASNSSTKSVTRSRYVRIASIFLTPCAPRARMSSW